MIGYRPAMIPEASRYRPLAGVAKAVLRRADRTARGVGTLVRCWPLRGPLGNLTAADDYATAVDVGDCADCGGVVLYSRRARYASCACGSTVVPFRHLSPHHRRRIERQA